MLLSILGDVKICQVVNPLKTVRMQLPIWITKKYGYDIPYFCNPVIKDVGLESFLVENSVF